jgi:hypothetical protein
LPGSHKLAHEIDFLRFITSSQHLEPVRQIISARGTEANDGLRRWQRHLEQ